MSRDPSEYVLTLYIHPDSGPIKPMTLDLLRVEVELGQSASSRYSADEERLRLIGEQIKARFPRLDPASNRAGLKSILARLSHVYQFNGVVLRLNGSTMIDTQADGSGNAQKAGADPESDQLKIQLQRLQQELPRLKRELEVEREVHRAAKERCVQLEREKHQLEQDRSRIYDRGRIQIDDLQQQLRHKDAEIAQIRRNMEQLVQERAALETVLERQQAHAEEEGKEREALQASIEQREEELSRLRMEHTNAAKDQQALRQKLQEQEDEINRLQQLLDSLSEMDTVGSAGGSGHEIHTDMLE